jgi:hypothetical protein
MSSLRLLPLASGWGNVLIEHLDSIQSNAILSQKSALDAVIQLQIGFVMSDCAPGQRQPGRFRSRNRLDAATPTK